MSTKLTKSQQAALVQLFASGTSMANLAQAYGVPVLRIEDIIRKAMPKPETTAPAQVEAFQP